MAYRQYPGNIARVLPPFTAEQVVTATELVLKHYLLVLEVTSISQYPQYFLLQSAYDNARTFYNAIKDSSDIMKSYVRDLNSLPTDHIWWSCVAHPALEEIWKN
jgi:hypothetical protein